MKREPTEKEQDRIARAIFAGDRVVATNVYISITECNLTRAQEYVKARTAELRSSDPERFSSRSQFRLRLFDIFPTTSH
jgi:hypothetical protein